MATFRFEVSFDVETTGHLDYINFAQDATRWLEEVIATHHPAWSNETTFDLSNIDVTPVWRR